MKTYSRKNDPTLEVKVVPQSSRSEITRDNEVIKVFLNSPPADGKANKECIKLLSKFFHVPKSSIMLIKGEKNRTKVFSFSGINSERIKKLIHGL